MRTSSSLRRIAFSAGAAALLALACWRAAPDEHCIGGGPAWSVQMHVHGSFSEGMGSIDSHSYEAKALGVDAIWWSDHDFRITSYRHVDHFGFEGPSQPVDAGESWSNALKRFAGDVKTIQRFGPGGAGSRADFVTDPVREGDHSLLLGVTGPGPDFRVTPCLLSASRKIHRRPLAGGLSLRLWVHPREVGADARPFVEVLLSEHAPRQGLGLEEYTLRYFLTTQAAAPWREGSIYHVPVHAVPGTWNELVLPLSEDCLAGFPFVPDRDDSLYRLVVGVEARRGAECEAAFDDLSIEHRQRGSVLYDIQREVLDQLQLEYPDVKQLQGVEVSYASRHLNEFSLDTRLLDYDAIAREVNAGGEEAGDFDEVSFRQAVVEKAVSGAHERGGLISYNHLFGIAEEGSEQRRSRDAQLEMLVKSRVFGVDILEVGYRDRGGASLADHLWVWDRLSLAGFRPVGTGVSDSHGGSDERWAGRPNNFVSWVYADQPDKPGLIEGLRSGRVYFGDIELWDGTLDLVTTRGQRMGQEVVTDQGEVDLELQLSNAGAGDHLVVIEGGREAERHTLTAGTNLIGYRCGGWTDGSSFVRFEVYDEGGVAKVLSNPIHLLRPEAVTESTSLVPARTAIDLLGLASREVSGFVLLGVEVLDSRRIRLRGRGAAGSLVFELDGRTISEVNWMGLTGTWVVEGERLCLRQMEGAGTVEIVL